MTDTPVRVDVNLLWLAPGRVGGSEQYLTRQLAGLPDGSRFHPRLLVQPPFVDAHPELSTRFATVAMPIRRDLRAARIVAEHTWLPWRTRGAGLVHHGGGTVPFGGGAPVVLTIHDLQYLRFPHYFSGGRLAYLRWMMPRSARRAAVVATPSDFVRGTVIDAFDLPPERVVTVLHGVPASMRPDGDAIAEATRSIGLSGRPYVVYPAITHPHKRHALLVDAVARIPDLTLVLLGGVGAAEPALQTAIARAGIAERVVRPGRVPDATRDALIAGARALAFPSEYEGFGAPLVEAMGLGTPVVCSDHTAVREVVGEAAVVVEASTPDAWAAALETVVGERTDLVERGRERAARFSLAASGAALTAAYQRALDLGAPG